MEDTLDNDIMNDDCLLTVFRNYDLKELTIMVRVSKQFERVAHNAFKLKFNNIQLSDHYYTMNTQLFNQVFIHFGHLIKEFNTISQCYPWYSNFTQTRIVSLVGRYCHSMETPLRVLKLNFFTSIDQNLDHLYKIFEHLEILTLSHVALPCSMASILNLLKNVKEVTLNYCIPSRHVIQTTEVDRNFYIQKLHLRCRQDLNMLQIMSAIDDAYPNVKDLSFEILCGNGAEYFEDNVHRIANMKKLKSLDISMMFKNLSLLTEKVIQNDIQLDISKLHHITVSEESMKDIYKMTSLKEFYTFDLYAAKEFDITGIATHLKNLRILSVMTEDMTIEKVINIASIAKNLLHGEFSMKNDAQWNEAYYNELLSIIKKQNKGTKLVLTLHKRGSYLDCRYTIREIMFLMEHESNTHLELNRQWNSVRSIFNNDWDQ